MVTEFCIRNALMVRAISLLAELSVISVCYHSLSQLQNCMFSLFTANR